MPALTSPLPPASSQDVADAVTFAPTFILDPKLESLFTGNAIARRIKQTLRRQQGAGSLATFREAQSCVADPESFRKACVALAVKKEPFLAALQSYTDRTAPEVGLDVRKAFIEVPLKLSGALVIDEPLYAPSILLRPELLRRYGASKLFSDEDSPNKSAEFVGNHQYGRGRLEFSFGMLTTESEDRRRIITRNILPITLEIIKAFRRVHLDEEAFKLHARLTRTIAHDSLHHLFPYVAPGSVSVNRHFAFESSFGHSARPRRPESPLSRWSYEVDPRGHIFPETAWYDDFEMFTYALFKKVCGEKELAPEVHGLKDLTNKVFQLLQDFTARSRAERVDEYSIRQVNAAFLGSFFSQLITVVDPNDPAFAAEIEENLGTIPLESISLAQLNIYSTNAYETIQFLRGRFPQYASFRIFAGMATGFSYERISKYAQDESLIDVDGVYRKLVEALSQELANNG